MKRIVVDASVALKWYLSDEDHGEKALNILDDYASSRITLHAPALLEFEIANALAIAKRRGRVGDDDTLKAMEGFIELDIEFYPLTPFFRKVLNYSSRYTISAYDASYVVLADDLKIDVVTADKRLIGSTRKLGFVKWIGDFRP